MRRSWMAAAAAVAAVSLVAACSSSGGGGTPTGSGSGGAANTSGGGGGATGTPIKLLQITGTGAGFAGFPHAVTAAQAAVKAVNDAGGVNGHPIELEECNDEFQPNAALACGRQAVSDHVVAVVGAYSGLGDNWMPALTKSNIPCIGCAGYSASESTSPMFFPLGAAGAPTVIAAGVAACGLGAKHPAVVYVGHAAGAFLAKSYDTGLKVCGDKAKEISIQQGGADFTAQAAQATSGTDLIDTIIGQPDINKFKADVASTGYKGYITDAYENAESDYYTAAPSLNANTYVQSVVVPAYVNDPSVKQFNDEMDKYADNPGSLRRTEAAEVAWAAVHVAADMLGKASSMDSAGLVAEMKTQTNYKFGPMAPVNWSKPIAAFAPLMVYSTQVYIAHITGTNKMEPAFQGGFISLDKVPTKA